MVLHGESERGVKGALLVLRWVEEGAKALTDARMVGAYGSRPTSSACFPHRTTCSFKV